MTPRTPSTRTLQRNIEEKRQEEVELFGELGPTKYALLRSPVSRLKTSPRVKPRPTRRSSI